jgi:hypothetical protein
MRNKRLNFLFWNMCKKPLSERLERISTFYDVDVLTLCESKLGSADVLKAINQNRTSDFFRFVSENERGIQVFTTEQRDNIEILTVSNRYFQGVRLKDENLLFFVVHLPSPLSGESAAYHRSGEIALEIIEIEARYTTNKTIVVGDFNVNPFHKSMVEHNKFNAVMAKDIIKKSTHRKVPSGSFPYFYNPMWSFLGDMSPHQSGTYYWSVNTYDNTFRWNMLDQVLLRAGIIDNLDNSSIRIVDNDGTDSLKLGKQLKGHSDHFPIYFSFNF